MEYYWKVQSESPRINSKKSISIIGRIEFCSNRITATKDMNENCNDRPNLSGADGEINTARMFRMVKAIRSRIGTFSGKIMQDGQKTMQMTRDKVFYSNIYTMIEGQRTLERTTVEEKDLGAAIWLTMVQLARSLEWTKNSPNRSVEADITLKWWKHSCKSKSGTISKADRKPEELILTTVSTNEDYLPPIKIPKVKEVKEVVTEDPPIYKEKRKHTLDKIEEDPKEVARAKKQKKNNALPSEDEVTEDPGLEPPEEAGMEVYMIWKKRKTVWAAKQVNASADRRGLAHKKNLNSGPVLSTKKN